MSKRAAEQPSSQAPKQPSSTNEGNFVSSLSRTLAAANAFLMERLRENGLANLVPSHGDILVCLFEGRPIAMQQLAERINRDPSTVTTLVKKLVAAGYACTRKNESDRRVTEVLLTDKGAELRAVFEKVGEELRATQMKGLDSASFATTCETLEQIRNNFSQALGEKNQ